MKNGAAAFLLTILALYLVNCGANPEVRADFAGLGHGRRV